jgi:hypothetical protein
MSISELYENQRAISLSEFGDIVADGNVLRLPSGEALKLRLQLIDDSFLEVNVSISGRYSYHWERRLIGRADIYRFDNAPHSAWRTVASYPAHFHNGRDEHVEASDISQDPIQAIRQVLTLIRRKLHAERLAQEGQAP